MRGYGFGEIRHIRMSFKACNQDTRRAGPRRVAFPLQMRWSEIKDCVSPVVVKLVSVDAIETEEVSWIILTHWLKTVVVNLELRVYM